MERIAQELIRKYGHPEPGEYGEMKGLYYRVGWIRSMAQYLTSGEAGFGKLGQGYQPYYAAKACPLPGVLRLMVQGGLGIECASMGEVQLAVACGAHADKILYGGPCKTLGEVAACLQAGYRLTCDNLDELALVEKLLLQDASLPAPEGRVSLRINPQLVDVDADNISVTSHPAAKFGAPLDEAADAISAAFRRLAWLRGIHVHVGSQHVAPEDAVRGIRKVADFAVTLGPSVQFFDVGGGCPVNYSAESLQSVRENMAHLAHLLKQQVPELMDGRWTLLTEFGRAMTCKAAFVLSRVEYCKQAGGRQLVITRVGAELFPRTAYQPAQWPHRVALLRSDGSLAEGASVLSVVGGPACFSGDLLARDVMLPPAHVGDFVLVKDAGAYTVASFTRFNSIARLPIYAVEVERDNGLDAELGEVTSVYCWNRAETASDVANFWLREDCEGKFKQ